MLTALAFAVSAMSGANAEQPTPVGHMPDETSPHEATWLQWPHHHTYGVEKRDRIESTWVQMTQALVASEKAHLIVYDAAEQKRVRAKLTSAKVPLDNVSFLIRRTDDVWVRDNGPIFVYDNDDNLKITDWSFNGWGKDAPYRKDQQVPATIASLLSMARVDLNKYVIEGGAIEVDGRGVLMATRSSILEPKRNPGMSQAQMESVLGKQLGVSKFIWLDGAPGGLDDVTDKHIDGFARFGDPRTIVTLSREDLNYWGLSAADIDELYRASDVDGNAYRFVQLPLTERSVVTTYGYDIGNKGSYANFYVGNKVVLIPEYKDPNDAVAKEILQRVYPGRTVVGIDVRNLYRHGGMIHCVTQQQPAKR
ncbi:agmatine deiminase family protein [Pseudomonas sp. CGJS7]|uniref:agmatine deiminase family protein n=1 Tax=Pseudomonas sp. CGJS7 TaxID=3109348 RepID=UPI00300B4041